MARAEQALDPEKAAPAHRPTVRGTTASKAIAPEAVTLEQALELLAAKAPKGGKRPARKAAGAKEKASAAKPAAKTRSVAP